MLKLAQKRLNLNKEDSISIMLIIAEFLSTCVKIREKNDQYWIRTFSLQSNLIDYLKEYPLFSSKYLDYMVWKRVINLIKRKEHKSLQSNIALIKKYKDSMNSNRKSFTWNHLNDFYSN
jgi:CTP synthase (UTP-ammonia lyase)